MKPRTFNTLAFLLAVAGVFLFLVIPDVWSADAGVGERQILVGLIQGSWGTVIGLLGAIFGLWHFLINQSFWGIVMIALGVIFTMFPSIFEMTYNGVNPWVEQTGSTRTDISIQ